MHEGQAANDSLFVRAPLTNQCCTCSPPHSCARARPPRTGSSQVRRALCRVPRSKVSAPASRALTCRWISLGCATCTRRFQSLSARRKAMKRSLRSLSLQCVLIPFSLFYLVACTRNSLLPASCDYVALLLSIASISRSELSLMCHCSGHAALRRTCKVVS